jgi:hypothetical protein
MPHRRFNADASKCLAQYEFRTFLSRYLVEKRATASLEAIADSQALFARVVELEARFAADAKRAGWLWPAWSSTAPGPAGA